MRHFRTLILDNRTIRKVLDIKPAIRAVESAFASYARKEARMPPKVYLDLPEFKGDFRAMPAYIKDGNACVLKWVNVHPQNKRKGLPTVMATVILSDPRTGFPLCILDGTHLTAVRTAAAAGVAAKYFSPVRSAVVALVGCGVQAVSQLEALKKVVKVKEVRVWGHKENYADAFIRKTKNGRVPIRPVKSVRECVDEADIVVTTTPSRRPLVKGEWLKDRVHINAIGADAEGKRELDFDIITGAKIVIDDWEQASHSGEINVALRKKKISKRNIYANLGDVITGKKKARVKRDRWTVFDSTGLGIQDAAVAQLAYRTAKRKNAGKWMDMV